MPMYEYQCKEGHVTEALLPIGSAVVPCSSCPPVTHTTPGGVSYNVPVFANRILSPTRTNFEFADSRKKPWDAP